VRQKRLDGERRVGDGPVGGAECGGGVKRGNCVGGVGGLEGHVAACVDDGGVDVFLHTGGEGGLDGIGFSWMGSRWRGLGGDNEKECKYGGMGSLGEAEQSFLNTRRMVDLRR
jgi:hypothetical protein